MTTADLDQYTKTVAQDYIKNSVALNDSITKIASTHGLNREQINRIVEAANTEVYVQLFNQSADKYVQFENADSEKIASVVFSDTPKVAETSISDYETSPEETYREKTGSVFNTNPEEEVKKPTEELNTYYKLAALQTQIENSMNELNVHYQSAVDTLYSMVKQAVLGGTPYGDIHKAITSVYPQPVVEVSMDEVQEKLATEMPLRKFEKTSEQIGTVNQENPLIKQAATLVKYAQEFITLRDKQTETTNELVNHIKSASVFQVKNAGWKLKTIGAGMLVGAGALAHKQISDIKQRDANSPLRGNQNTNL